MKVLGLAALATALAWFGWVVQAKQANNLENPGGGPASVTGTLLPGGTLVGPDKVTIRPVENPDFVSARVTIDCLSQAQLSIPLPSDLEFVGSLYRISVVENRDIGPGLAVDIVFGIPGSVLASDIRIAVLRPPPVTAENTNLPQLYWDLVENRRFNNESRQVVAYNISNPGPEGLVFALVRLVSPTTQNLNATVPTTTTITATRYK